MTDTAIKLPRKKINWKNVWPPVLTLILIVVVWELIVKIFHVSEVVIPAPSAIYRETTKYFVSELLDDWLATAKIIAIGYFTGVPTGILLASLISQSKLLIKALSPLLTVFVTLPTMVVIPIFMVWVGYSIEYRAIPVFFNVASIVTLSTLSGFINVENRMLELGQSYGANRLQTFTKFIFPNALPEIFQGLRLGCTFSILNVIGIELIAGKIGMGFAVQYFSGLLKMAIVWGCIVIVGFTGRAMYLLVELLESKLVTWTK